VASWKVQKRREVDARARGPRGGSYLEVRRRTPPTADASVGGKRVSLESGGRYSAVSGVLKGRPTSRCSTNGAEK